MSGSKAIMFLTLGIPTHGRFEKRLLNFQVLDRDYSHRASATRLGTSREFNVEFCLKLPRWLHIGRQECSQMVYSSSCFPPWPLTLQRV